LSIIELITQYLTTDNNNMKENQSQAAASKVDAFSPSRPKRTIAAALEGLSIFTFFDPNSPWVVRSPLHFEMQ
jgi:hypothetical protein